MGQIVSRYERTGLCKEIQQLVQYNKEERARKVQYSNSAFGKTIATSL